MPRQDNSPMTDEARHNIALYRLAQIHQRCVEIAQSAEATEQTEDDRHENAPQGWQATSGASEAEEVDGNG